MYNRFLEEKIRKSFENQKITILYGARQVWKTTLIKRIFDEKASDSIFLNGDFYDDRQYLQFRNERDVHNLIGTKKYLFIDEAQRVENIWLMLKIIHDTDIAVHVLATWSSSFDLANKINEPLTGRYRDFMMYPLSLGEIVQDNARLAMRFSEEMMIFGSYPAQMTRNFDDKKNYIKNIVNNYLYKDVLERDAIRKADVLISLIQLLALQIWSEVSYNELSNKLWVKADTVMKYIDVLQKSFVIFSLKALSRNKRNEIGKKQKIYFWDLWVRNGVINNFNPLHLRNDVWSLRENFCIAERLKKNHYNDHLATSYFWRTYDHQELDYIEEYNGNLHWYECKYTKKIFTKPKAFFATYPDATCELINKDTMTDFLL